MKEIEKRIEKRSAQYYAESNLKNEQTRRDLAHSAACLFETLHMLTMEKLSGQGKAEETRTITAIAGSYRRCMLDLGVTSERVDVDVDL
jgi:hypothetical protein